MNPYNYKVKVDPTPLSDEQVMKHKDFKKVLQNYHRMTQPLYLRPRMLSAFIAVVTISIVLIWFDDAVSNKTPFVNPPVAGLNIPYIDSGLIAEKGGMIQYENGTQIIFPPNVFVDKEGESVTGPVEIKYREFHDQADILFSGIPMKYDSSGKEYFLESAGMFDLRAFQHGEPVFVSPGKEIEVRMASTVREPGFNIYYLDTNEREWVYRGQELAPLHPDPANQTDSDSSSLSYPDSIPAETPVQTTSASLQPAGKNRFIFDLSYEDFPEFAAYENVTWEMDDMEKDFNPQWLYEKSWDDAKIIYAATDGSYMIRLISEEQEYTLKARPVLNENEQKKALAAYKSLEGMQSTLLKKKLESEQQQYARESEARIAREKIKNELKETGELMVKRVMNINRLGYWNWDKPIMQQFSRNRIAAVKYDQPIDPASQQLFYVDRGINTVFPTNVGGYCPFKPEKSMILSVMPDGKIAIYTAREYANNPPKAEKENSDAFIYELRVIETVFKSVDEIKKELGLGELTL